MFFETASPVAQASLRLYAAEHELLILLPPLRSGTTGMYLVAMLRGGETQDTEDAGQAFCQLIDIPNPTIIVKTKEKK